MALCMGLTIKSGRDLLEHVHLSNPRRTPCSAVGDGAGFRLHAAVLRSVRLGQSSSPPSEFEELLPELSSWPLQTIGQIRIQSLSIVSSRSRLDDASILLINADICHLHIFLCLPSLLQEYLLQPTFPQNRLTRGLKEARNFPATKPLSQN